MIFPAFYFGPISYFAQLIQHDEIQLEAFENYPKQTYRNRCFIQGANGKLRLVIPISHDGVRTFKDIKVSEDYPWRKEHLKSLESAYRSSPYYEYYEDDLLPIFDKKNKFLLDINLMTFDFINSKLKLDLKYSLTENYIQVSSDNDFRNQFNSKVEPNPEDFPPYIQVFEEKQNFLPDLSIIDLLCNEGPNSTTYLKQLIIK